MLSFTRLFKSFRDAIRGLWHAFKNEQNFRIQTFIGLLVLAGAFFLPLRIWEKVLLIFLVGWVLTMELLNTAFEYFSDLLKPRLHHYVYLIKDVMAGAVFLSSLVAFIIGIMIFLPYILNLFSSHV